MRVRGRGELTARGAQVGVVSLCSAAWAVADAGGSLSAWVAAASAGLHHQAVLGAVLWTGLVTTALCSEYSSNHHTPFAIMISPS